MRKDDILARIDDVIAKGKATIDSAPPPGGGVRAKALTQVHPDNLWVEPGPASSFRSAGLSLLRSLYGAGHVYYKGFDEATHDKRIVGSYRTALGLMLAVREEVDRGWYADTKALIASDIFSNILEMAEYFLSEGYKDAAAVLVGGALEGHLRELCGRNGVDTHQDQGGKRRPRKAESLNQDLHKKDVFSLGDQKQITAWLDLRNEAAHGHHDKYNLEQVDLMRRGVVDFINRVPA